MGDPIQVLREMGPTHMYRSPEHIERWDAALQQVEALVQAARAMPYHAMELAGKEGWALEEALAPFKKNPR